MEIPESVLGLMRWVGAAQGKAADDWSRERGLSMQQAFTLGWLIDNPGAIQRDVARVSRTSAASASSLLQGLERRGLIERRTEGGDERSKRVYPTPSAIELTSGFEAAMAAVEQSVLATLTEQERDTLRRLLTKIVEKLPPPTRP